MSVLVLIDDLMFKSQVREVGVAQSVDLIFIRKGEPIVPMESVRTILLDLHLRSRDPFSAISELQNNFPGARLIGFFSHVDEVTAARAREMGVEEVLPRSLFVKKLPQLLT